ncbi:MAG: hypothetical protein JXB46_10165 [Candidatus Eisenbacteria bacterium]|nr:hypothetical protein [Candidatus Eisenbacteria bacterium]
MQGESATLRQRSGRQSDGIDELHAEIERRLDEVTAADYEDPARKDLTVLDWVTLAGFLAACAIGFTIWGY